MSRKQPKRRAGSLASIAIAGIFMLVVACGVGFGVASADSTDELARAGAFGFDEATHTATRAADEGEAVTSQDAVSVRDQGALASTSTRDITAGLAMVDELEAEEQARIEADNIAVVERVESEKAKQGVVSETPASEAPAEEAVEYSLPAVDWSCGKEAFVAEWTARIDAYLSGSTLDGYGKVFAEAAWDNGVDPRWSPAISNTESGKGAVCFRDHNAWGWGNGGWSDWETAIREHVAGLARAYGYSITPSAAATYCPPNAANWYSSTVEQMAII